MPFQLLTEVNIECPCGKTFKKMGDVAGAKKWEQLHGRVCEQWRASKETEHSVNFSIQERTNSPLKLVGVKEFTTDIKGKTTEAKKKGRFMGNMAKYGEEYKPER